eukprot:14365456-Alexandrium_andersonii.AAC.1
MWRLAARALGAFGSGSGRATEAEALRTADGAPTAGGPLGVAESVTSGEADGQVSTASATGFSRREGRS